MINQLLTLEFCLEVGIALIIGIGFIFIGSKLFIQKPRAGAETPQPRLLKTEYITTPINTSITIISILIPFLIAVTAYCYSQNAMEGIPSVLASITLLFFSVAVAIWEIFTLIKKGTKEDYISLDYPNRDKGFVMGLGLIYSFMFFSFIFFGKFLLFNLKISSNTNDENIRTNKVYISRSLIYPGLSKQNVVELWGKPDSIDQTKKVNFYKSDKCTFELTYDSEELLERLLIETK